MTAQAIPKNEKPSDLFARLTQTPRPHKLVTFPRKGLDKEEQVAIWVLTESELMAARSSAAKYAKKILDDQDLTKQDNLGYQEIYRNECVVQVVCRACRDPQNLKIPSFPNPDLARQWMTSDEFAVLFEAYCIWQAESGPIVGSMDEETMNAWIGRLQEGASQVPLALLSSAARDQLLMHSVSRLPRSLTDSGSAGSPPSDTSTKGPSERSDVWETSERPPDASA
jgi:hypothetical protein